MEIENFLGKPVDSVTVPATAVLQPTGTATGLHTEGISVSGKSGRQLLRDIHIDVDQGEAYALCGRDAAAKRLLTRILASGLYREPVAIADDASALLDLPLTETAAYAGDFGRCFGFMTAREYMVYMLGTLKIAREALQARIDELFALTGITHAADRKIRRLSDCEYLMLCLALQLFYNPAIVLLNADRVTASREAIALLNYTVAGLKEQNKAILVNVGDIGLVGDAFDLVGILAGGEIAASGPPSELVKQYAEKVYSIRTESNIRALAAKFRSLERDLKVRVRGDKLYISADNTLETGKLLVETLDAESAELLEMNLRVPTLESAYKKVVNGK